MAVPKINSAHGSDTRNLINRAIDVLNQQGKTIQDLVADGQLTEKQYAELITVINGHLKSGEVDKLDLSESLRKEVEKVNRKRDKSVPVTLNDVSLDFLAAIEGGGQTSFNLLSVPRDHSVTPEKTNFLKRGKNKWDGTFEEGLRVSGGTSIGMIARSSEGVKSFIFKGDPLSTHTIQRKNGGNLYHVATFKDQPKADSEASRAINDGSSYYEQITITLDEEEHYIMLSISDDGTEPQKFQIEEGPEGTEIIEPNSVRVLLDDEAIEYRHIKKDSLKNRITPDELNFVEKGKNLWDGEFVEDVRMGGAPPHVVSSDEGAFSVIFKGEKGKTYSISKEDNSSWFGIATFLYYPNVGVSGNRSIRGNTTPGNTQTLTLEGEEEYIFISLSSGSENTKPNWLQIEEGSEVTSYVEPNSVRIKLENGNGNGGDSSLSHRKINAVKVGDELSIYVPSKTTPNRFMRHDYRRTVDTSQNLDTWILRETGMYTKQNDVYTKEFVIMDVGDNEGVLRINGEGDFIGGNHGFDTMEFLDVIIDGNQVDMNNDFDVECSFVKIVNKSTVYHDETSDKAFTRFKVHTWDLDTMTLEGRWIAEHEIQVMSSKLCDFAIYKEDNGKNIAKWGRNDATYEKVDLSGEFEDGPSVRLKDINLQEVWSDEANFYVGLWCDYKKEDYPNRSNYIEDFGNRVKIYFDLTTDHTFSAGEEINYKNHYEFSY